MRSLLAAVTLMACGDGFVVSPRRAGAFALRAGGGGDWDLNLFSPAKVNLFLRILRKREDGFHELASLFQAIDLGDTLRVAVDAGAGGDVLECDDPACPTDASNLVLRAVALYRSKIGDRAALPPLRVRLEKRTPIQAGLGGGSSNAAAALRACNLLCDGAATDGELIEWSGALGSDITFFLGPTGSAYCTGRGEVLEPVPPLETQSLWVVKPTAVGLSTPLVFKTLAGDGYASLAPDDPRDLLAAFAKGGVPAPAAFVNDLEAPAFALEPALATIKATLLEEPYACSAAMMSGSGTSLFGLAQPKKDDAHDADLVARLKATVKRDTGLDVDVWRTDFAAREPGGWYDAPDAKTGA